ncbi:MAG TPA: HAD family phosphatase [Burkholderiaceae bacterium]
MKKNIVFDFAGVVFTWQPHDFMARLLPQRAATPEAARAFVGEFFESFGGDWGEFDRGSIEPAPLAERMARRLGLSLADARRVIDAVPHELVPIDGTVALLKRLHARGHALFFLSNMPAPYADHLDATHDFIGLFRRGIYSARVGLIKPEPAIFAHALERFGIAARDTVFIDDMAANVEAARAAGWQALQFLDPTQCEAELARLGVL